MASAQDLTAKIGRLREGVKIMTFQGDTTAFMSSTCDESTSGVFGDPLKKFIREQLEARFPQDQVIISTKDDLTSLQIVTGPDDKHPLEVILHDLRSNDENGPVSYTDFLFSLPQGALEVFSENLGTATDPRMVRQNMMGTLASIEIGKGGLISLSRWKTNNPSSRRSVLLSKDLSEVAISAFNALGFSQGPLADVMLKLHPADRLRIDTEAKTKKREEQSEHDTAGGETSGFF